MNMRVFKSAILAWAAGSLLVVSTMSSAQEDPAGSFAAEDASTEDADFNQELLSIEEEVSSLKEQVFRSKATLQLLKEIVVQGTSEGSKATIWHVNKLGSGYT